MFARQLCLIVKTRHFSLGVMFYCQWLWETGTNMPDLSILIQMAEFYKVEVKEILDGERKSESMDKELKLKSAARRRLIHI